MRLNYDPWNLDIESGIKRNIQSIFTPGGANARRLQDERNSGVGLAGSKIAGAALPGLMNQIGFANSIEPAREGAITRTLGLLNPGTVAGMAEKQVGQIQQGGQDAISNTKNQFASAGLSAGALGGAIGDIGNNTTQAINSTRGQVFDPITQAKLGELTAGIASGGQKVDTGAFNAGTAATFGQPATQVQPGFGDIIGNAVGQWSGGGFK